MPSDIGGHLKVTLDEAVSIKKVGSSFTKKGYVPVHFLARHNTGMHRSPKDVDLLPKLRS